MASNDNDNDGGLAGTDGAAPVFVLQPNDGAFIANGHGANGAGDAGAGAPNPGLTNAQKANITDLLFGTDPAQLLLLRGYALTIKASEELRLLIEAALNSEDVVRAAIHENGPLISKALREIETAACDDDKQMVRKLRRLWTIGLGTYYARKKKRTDALLDAYAATRLTSKSWTDENKAQLVQNMRAMMTLAAGLKANLRARIIAVI